ncbi:pyridoxamine 5'-phosphate oxidase family protein [Marinomonas sp. THO17]|uniref:pyridoxamine 5'-phosphate oxidase family protein n=1 Tax=Marinomonas sp. THO17 TaxID=3149048 RepID=UPI00336C1C2C
MLTDEVKKSIEESVLCWLATADSSGEPNCSPKEVFTHHDSNTLLIAHIASPESVKNIQSNAKVCVSFVHVLKQKGFKLKGHATYIDASESHYPELYKLIQPVAYGFPVKGIIQVKITRVSPILAPSYYLLPGTTEESQIASARQAYGI